MARLAIYCLVLPGQWEGGQRVIHGGLFPPLRRVAPFAACAEQAVMRIIGEVAVGAICGGSLKRTGGVAILAGGTLVGSS